MARDKNVPLTEDSRVPEAQTDDEFLSELLALRPLVEAAARSRNDLTTPALLNIGAGIDTLADALRTLDALERADA